MIQVHYIYSALYVYYYISFTSDHQVLDPGDWGLPPQGYTQKGSGWVRGSMHLQPCYLLSKWCPLLHPVRKPVLTSQYCQLLNFCQLGAVEHYLILFLISISLIACETEPLFRSASLRVNFIFPLIIYKHLFYSLCTFVGHVGCRYFFLTYGLYFLFVYVTFIRNLQRILILM